MVSTLLFLRLGRIVWVYTYFSGRRALDVLYYSHPLSWLLTFTTNTVLFPVFFRRLRKSA